MTAYGSLVIYCRKEDRDFTAKKLKDAGYCYTCYEKDNRLEFHVPVAADLLNKTVRGG